jgi:hypothetical protein
MRKTFKFRKKIKQWLSLQAEPGKMGGLHSVTTDAIRVGFVSKYARISRSRWKTTSLF